MIRTINLFQPPDNLLERKLAYYEFGDIDNPHVVFCVHGLSRNARDFDFLANVLAQDFRVICPDMAGRGQSDWLNNKDSYNYATYAADCVELLSYLQIQSVMWVGTSMGGIVGMMLASSMPHLFKGLVLNDVGMIVSARGLKRILNYVGATDSFENSELAMKYLRSTLAPFGITDEEQWQHMFNISFIPQKGGQYKLNYDPDITTSLRKNTSMAESIEDVDLTVLWNNIQCPTLILRGENSDILERNTAVSMCNRSIPTSLVEFANVAHAPALLENTQIKVIQDWVSQTLDT